MNIDIPELKCQVSIETFSHNGSIANKSSSTDSCLKLGRDREGNCVLSIFDNKNNQKEMKRYTFFKNQENYRLNTKFVAQGKASILISGLNQRIFSEYELN